MGTKRNYTLIACLLAGCNSSGSLDLTLSLPTNPILRPIGMTTVTVTATAPGESPIANTSVLENNKFSAGDLPVGDDVQIGVVLRDVSNRIVGVGEADQTVDIVGDQATAITIPVRRPFVFASASDGLHSFDPTLDPRDTKFQGTVGGIVAPLFTISVGGDRLAVITNDRVVVVVTDQNTVLPPITIPTGARDATAIPGTHKLAVAHGTGITVVDLDTMAVVGTAAVGPVDRVTAGPATDGTLYAYGLVGRVVPPELPGPFGACTGSSSVVAVSVDAPATVSPKMLGQAISDLASAPDVAMVFATLPCTNQVARLVGDPTAEVGTLSLEKLSDLERAAVLTVAGHRVWAAGTTTATPWCDNASPTNGTCSASSKVSCTSTGSNDVLYAAEGATLVVQSIPLAGGEPIEFVAPGRRETMIDTRDDAEQHAQVLKAIGVVPLDLVTLPGGQYVSLVAKSRYYIAALAGGLGIALPCLDAETSDWLLIDLASSAVSQRVRTFCDVQVEPPTGAQFPSWACDEPPLAERSNTSYKPASVGALFGAR